MLRIMGGGGWLNKLKIVSILIQRGQYLPEWQLHFYIIQNRIRGVSMLRVIQFDQEGKFLAQWTQFGRPSGIFFDEQDNIYISDSESDNIDNPGYELGIRIGDAHMGWVHYFIPLQDGDPRVKKGNGAEFVAVDKHGNIYGGEPHPRKLKKYERVRQ